MTTPTNRFAKALKYCQSRLQSGNQIHCCFDEIIEALQLASDLQAQKDKEQEAVDVKRPFCKQDGFDLVGLKHHLNFHCGVIDSIQDRGLFEDQEDAEDMFHDVLASKVVK